MAILDTLIAELLKDGVNKATGGKGIAKKLEEAIKKESSGSKAKQATTAAEKRAIRNAFTLGAPSDDRKAKARAMAAQAIFNDLERSKASPEELAAAKREADSWANWASLPKSTRENILSRGRRQAELGNAESKMSDVMRERQTPGAEELLKYEADVMAGRNPEAFKSETSSTGRKVVYRNGIPVGFSGAAPSPIGDAEERSMVNRTGLFSPGERSSIRNQIMAEAVNPTSPAPRPSPSYAQNILMDFQSRQPSAPQAFQYQPDAYSILNAPASTPSTTPVQTIAPAPVAAPPAPVPVAPSDIVLAAQEAEAQRKATETNLSILSFQDQWQKNNLSNNKDRDAPGVAADVARFNRRWRSPEGTAEDLLFANTWQPKSTPLLTPLQEWRNGILARRLEASKKKQEESQGFSFPPL